MEKKKISDQIKFLFLCCAFIKKIMYFVRSKRETRLVYPNLEFPEKDENPNIEDDEAATEVEETGSETSSIKNN